MNLKDFDWWQWIAIVVLFTGLLMMIQSLGYPETVIDFSIVDSSVYSKVSNYTKYWDKSVEYYRTDLDIWNEVWIVPDRYSLEMDAQVDLIDSTSQARLTGNWTKGISKNYTIEIGAGIQWEGPQVFPLVICSNRFLFDVILVSIGVNNYVYVPVMGNVGMRNDVRLKVNTVLWGFFSILSRQEFINNNFSNYTAGCFSFKF